MAIIPMSGAREDTLSVGGRGGAGFNPKEDKNRTGGLYHCHLIDTSFRGRVLLKLLLLSNAAVVLNRCPKWPRGVPASELCAFIVSILYSMLETQCVVNKHEFTHHGIILSDGD